MHGLNERGSPSGEKMKKAGQAETTSYCIVGGPGRPCYCCSYPRVSDSSGRDSSHSDGGDGTGEKTDGGKSRVARQALPGVATPRYRDRGGKNEAFQTELLAC